MSRPTLSVGASLVRVALAASVVLAPAAAARGQTSTWTGGSPTSDNWSDTANWSGTTIPVNMGTSALFFAGTTRLTPNDDFTTYTATALTFDLTAGAFTLAGNPLNLTGDVTNNSGLLQT